MIAKFLMWVWKKLHGSTNDWIVLTSVGGYTSLMALTLPLPGLIPPGVRVKPRYETSLLPKSICLDWSSSCFAEGIAELYPALEDNLHEFQCGPVSHQCKQWRWKYYVALPPWDIENWLGSRVTPLAMWSIDSGLVQGLGVPWEVVTFLLVASAKSPMWDLTMKILLNLLCQCHQYSVWFLSWNIFQCWIVYWFHGSLEPL